MKYVKLVSVSGHVTASGAIFLWAVDELGRLWTRDDYGLDSEGRRRATWAQLERPTETEPPLKFPKGDERGGG